MIFPGETHQSLVIDVLRFVFVDDFKDLLPLGTWRFGLGVLVVNTAVQDQHHFQSEYQYVGTNGLGKQWPYFLLID